MAGESVWTDSKITKMRELATAGMKSSEIAAVLRIGKAAVLGKCHREGVRLLATPPKFIVRRPGAAVPPPAPTASTVFAHAPRARRSIPGGCAWLDRAPGGWIECAAPPLRREFYCKKHCRVAFPETGKEAA